MYKFSGPPITPPEKSASYASLSPPHAGGIFRVRERSTIPQIRRASRIVQ
jgi:hypothetical protein